MWNSLPNELRKVEDFDEFMSLSTRGVAPLVNVLCVSLVYSLF